MCKKSSTGYKPGLSWLHSQSIVPLGKIRKESPLFMPKVHSGMK